MRVREHAPSYGPRTKMRTLPGSRRRRLVSERAYLEMEGRWDYDHGILEKVPVPNNPHQDIIIFMLEAIRDFSTKEPIKTRMLPGTRIQLGKGKYRDPDLSYFPGNTRNERDRHQYMEIPEWILEVTSDKKRDRERDLIIKREEYAKAGIPEYWIIDPKEKRILVLVLDGKKYRENRYQIGDTAVSERLPGFKVNVLELFEAAGVK